ncbi:MAG: DMT family transporter [Bryobacteraceae bacterium]
MSEGPTRKPARLYALLAVMVFVWSVNFVVAKTALREIPPLMLGSLRFTLAGLLIAPIYLLRQLSEKRPLFVGPDTLRLVGLGLIGVGANQLVFQVGLVRTTIAHAALLIAMTPVLVLLLSSWVGHERITRSKLAGLGIAVGGVLVLQGRALIGGHGSALGDFFVMLAALTFAIYTVFGKSIRAHYDSLTMTTFAYTGSAILLLPSTLWIASGVDFDKVTWVGWTSVVFMAIFPSIIAYLIFYYALRYLQPSRLSMLAYLQPPLATLFGVFLLGEELTASLFAGGALVLGGVLLAERLA